MDNVNGKSLIQLFYTKGNSSLDSNANNIAITVEGAWKPWGNLEINGKMCKLDTCTGGFGENCYPDGKKTEVGAKQANIPCCIKDGYGIYGLIALNNRDPNDVAVLDKDNFKTFRVGPLKVSEYKPSTTSGDDSKKVTIKTYVLKYIENWNPESKTFTKEPIPAGGTIYFKIEDSYYRDNVGAYKIRVDNGAFIKKKGFVEKLIEFFKDTFAKVQKIIYDNIVKDSGFRTIARILLALFVIFSVIFFMLGLIELNQTELVVRLFKIGIISTVISDATLNVIPDLFNGIINSAVDISTVIMKESMFDPINNRPLLPFPELTTVFSAYDGVIEMVTSKAFNVKIWGILFTSRFYLIIGIYICIILMFIGMWKSLVQYIMSFFLLALLIIILPIFIITILFKQTIHFFDQWLEQFIGSCVMLIVITATVGLMLSLIITQLQDMLYYTVCWDTIFSWKPLGITIIDFKFWKANSWDEFTKVVTAKNFFYVLISCVLFRVYIDYVPELVDALGGVARRPLSGVYGGVMDTFDGFVKNQIYGSNFYKALDKNILSPIKQRMGLLHYVDRASHGVFKTEKDSIIKKGMDATKGVTQYATSAWSDFTGSADHSASLGVYDIGKEERKVDDKIDELKAKGKEFAKEFGKLKEAFKDMNIRRGEGKSRDLMQKMLSEDKATLDQSFANLDTRYDALKAEKGAVFDSKQLIEGRLDKIEGAQNQLDQRNVELNQERQKLDDVQSKDAQLMALKDQRDPLDVNKVEERYQELLQERYGTQERELAEKQQQLEQGRLSLEQERENFAQMLEKHQQNVEDYQNSMSKFEEDRNLAQQQYELYEEQQRVLDGGVSKYEIREDLNRTNDEMNQTVDLFHSKQQELSTSQAQLEEQLRQLDELNKQLEQQRELAEQLAQEVQKSKDKPDDHDEGERLRLNDALEKRYVQVEQLQSQLEQERETYNQNYEHQAQEYNQHSQDMARAQDEVSSTQQLYEQRQSELESYHSSVGDKWDSSDLYLEPKSTPDQSLQQEVHHDETAMEKIAKIQEEAERYQQKMDKMKKLEEEIFDERRKIK